MKRKLLTLLMMSVVLVTVAWTPPKAECFGCTAAAKTACIDEANNVYWACFDIYGDLGDAICTKRQREYLDTCFMMHGCPIKPWNP